jgi:cell division protein YceG involved in septum cleavage
MAGRALQFFGAGAKVSTTRPRPDCGCWRGMARKRRKSMKKQMLAAAFTLVFTSLAPTRSQAQQVMQAQIPFTFQAGSTMLPAGEYRVQPAFTATETVQQLRDADSSSAVFVGTYSVDPGNKHVEPRLIFNCYTNVCFLSEIWTGNGQGRKLVQSRREKELSRMKAENELAVVSLPLTVAP